MTITGSERQKGRVRRDGQRCVARGDTLAGVYEELGRS